MHVGTGTTCFSAILLNHFGIQSSTKKLTEAACLIMKGPAAIAAGVDIFNAFTFQGLLGDILLQLATETTPTASWTALRQSPRQ